MAKRASEETGFVPVSTADVNNSVINDASVSTDHNSNKKVKHNSPKLSSKFVVESAVIEEIKTEENLTAIYDATSKDTNLIAIVFLFATWSAPCKTILVAYQNLINKLASVAAADIIAESAESTKQYPTANDVPTEVSSELWNISSPATLKFRFYKIDKDKGPRSGTTAKVPMYIAYRDGEKLGEISTQGKSLERRIEKFELQ
ncbi:hypothetical protein HK100_003251 [Physocladia obscura]|uniref:Thioredoxin domain-containing protein n=1 Tax=Physocladia obscura TaxID=109957 RepID=A0AAD5XMS3_9FUNG|nr:hypothetical protein HK100_003251 [Physocladia obscura]